MASPVLIIPVLPLLNEQNKLRVALPIFVSTFWFETEEAFERLKFFLLLMVLSSSHYPALVQYFRDSQ